MPVKQGAFGESPAPAEAPKRRRRTKAEMIADAVVPANDATVEVKFIGTGTKGERTWPEAVVLFREDKIEFIDKTLKYAVEKYEQLATMMPTQANAPKLADLVSHWNELQRHLDEANLTEDEKQQVESDAELLREQIIAAGGQDPASDEAYAARASDIPRHSNGIPLEAELGDEIMIGGMLRYVGHNNQTSQVRPVHGFTKEPIEAQKRWLEDGTYVDLAKERTQEKAAQKGFFDSAVTSLTSSAGGAVSMTVSPSGASSVSVTPAPTPSKGNGVTVEREQLPARIEQVDLNVWQVSTGVLEKIGLPDYSSLQIGPIHASRKVLDDGRRTKVQIGKREAEIPTATIEGFREAADVVEFITREVRGQLVDFLEAVKPGSTMPQS